MTEDQGHEREHEALVASLADAHGLALTDAAIQGLARYTALLLRHGRRTNLVGTLDPERLLDEVILDAVHLAPLLPPGPGHLLDVGSGAGLPGLPVLIVREDWQATLVEPRKRRVDFLRIARRELNLSERARIVEGRLESAIANGSIDLPVDAAAAKAVFAPEAWCSLAESVVRPGGHVAIFLQDAAEAEHLATGGPWTMGPVSTWMLRRGDSRSVALLVRDPTPPRPENP